MSVYKSKRSESSMQFVDTAKKLEAFTLSCCMKAPKRYTFFLTSRIMQLASDVHEHATAANNIWPTNQHEAQMRRDELTRANIAVQMDWESHGAVGCDDRGGSEAAGSCPEERPAAVQGFAGRACWSFGRIDNMG